MSGSNGNCKFGCPQIVYIQAGDTDNSQINHFRWQVLQREAAGKVVCKGTSGVTDKQKQGRLIQAEGTIRSWGWPRTPKDQNNWRCMSWGRTVRATSTMLAGPDGPEHHHPGSRKSQVILGTRNKGWPRCALNGRYASDLWRLSERRNGKHPVSNSLSLTPCWKDRIFKIKYSSTGFFPW